MTAVTLGKLTTGGRPFKVDIPRLLETRWMFQAGSGGGKSYGLRKLIEETHGKVQQIIIDKDGEFASLREAGDYVLVGRGGDVPADTRSAGLMARKTLELGMSVILDLSELKRDDREVYVRDFLESLMEAPKTLWHPVLVVIDECDVFAPEGARSKSLLAVVDVAARGRKRGFALIIATQRISKLSKDVAAECLNKAIGRTGLDIDMKRSADELGISAKDRVKIRDLEPGEFYVFGPAINKEVELAKFGRVKTTHGRQGKHGKTKPPAPTSKIKKVLAQLADLPAEAAQELQDKEALKARVRELEQAVKKASAGAPDPKALERSRADGIKEGIAIMKAEVTKVIKDLQVAVDGAIAAARDRILKAAAGKPGSAPIPIPAGFSLNKGAAAKSVAPAPRPPVERAVRATAAVAGDGSYGKCERGILKFLVLRPNQSFTKGQVGAMTGYSPTGGGFLNSISRLSKAGLVKRAGRGLQIDDTSMAAAILGDDGSDIDPRTALEDWLGKLSKCPKVIYEQLLRDQRNWTKEELADATGYAPTGGGFLNAISSLCTLGLVVRNSNGTISINPELTEL